MTKKIRFTTDSLKKAQKQSFRKRLNVFLEKPEKVFMSTALVFGLASIIIMPIFSVPDEAIHFYRAYHVGEGHLIGKNINGKIGSYAPQFPSQLTTKRNGSTVTVPVHQYFKRITSPEVFTPYPTSAVASPFMYIPQAIGVDMGRLVNGSLGSMVLMGRLINLMAYIILVTFAIRIAKMGKWVYAVIGLFPVAIQQAGSLSADVMTTGLAFITIAFIHNLFMRENVLKIKHLLIICLLGVGLALTKQNNILLLIPLFFLPTNLFKTKSQKFGFVAVVFSATIFALASWYIFVHFSYNGLSPAVDTGSENVNAVVQLKHVISNPMSFVRVLIKSFVYEGRGIPLPDFYLESMHGVFSLISYKLPLEFILLGYGLLMTALLSKDDNELSQIGKRRLPRIAVVQGAVFVISVVAIAGMLYLFWTPVASSQVEGIQGRYFIPLVPLLIPVFAVLSRWFKVIFDAPYRLGLLVMSISSLNLLAMLALTLKWFYI